MIVYTFKIAFRELVRNREATFINVFGLSLGLACFTAIFIYIHQELRYDEYHQNYQEIYKLNITETGTEGHNNILAIAPGGWGPELAHNFPHFKRCARIYKCRVDAIVEYNDDKFYEKHFLFADPDALDIFTFEFTSGASAVSLHGSTSVIISDRAADKYFGDENPLGKTIKYTDTEGEIILTVSGVFKSFPSNVHFTLDFIGNLAALDNVVTEEGSPLIQSMNAPLYHTYFLIRNKADLPNLTSSINRFLSTRLNDDIKYRATLVPLKDIHFQRSVAWEFQAGSSKNSLYIFSSIALLILAVACINFMNLASAQAEKRIKAMSIRKLLGTSTRGLMLISLTEALISSIISLIGSVTLIEIFLPLLNEHLGQNYEMTYFGPGSHVPYLIGVAVAVGLITGCYPALFMSKANPLIVVKGQATVVKGLTFRRSLVVFQFGISAFLIIATTFISDQMDFLLTKDVGFDRDIVLNIPARGEEAGGNFEVYRNAITAHQGVVEVNGSFHRPFEKVWENIRFESDLGVREEVFFANQFNATDGFLKTFGVKLVAGRDFTKADTGAFLLNESAVRELGLTNENAIGIQVEDKDIFHAPGKVVGVVEDFHYQSLHQKIRPLAIWYMPYWPNFMSVKMKGIDGRETIAFLESQWDKINPDTPFDYSFLEDDLNSLYESEGKMAFIFKIFSGIAVIIACLGLYGLSKVSISKRIKEITIRRVLGGGVRDLVFLLSREYIVLVLIAVLIFSPLTYFAVSEWMVSFAYHAELNILVFLLTGVVLLFLCVLTIGHQAIKTASKNPADVMRYE